MIISDFEWQEIRRLGKLPDTKLARAHVQECFDEVLPSYFEKQISAEIRSIGKKSEAAAFQLAKLLRRLSMSREFLFFGDGLNDGDKTSLQKMILHIEATRVFLSAQNVRLQTKRKSSWKKKVFGQFVSNLVFVRADHTGRPVPCSSKPTSETGEWLEYVRYCFALVDPKISRVTINSAIDYIMEGHAGHRTRWEEYFQPIDSVESQRRSLEQMFKI